MKSPNQARTPPPVLTLRLLALVLGATAALVSTTTAKAHGFTADTVDIKRLPNGKYRVFINYTHLQIGEYRQAHIDFAEKKKAIEAFNKLVRGAEFFSGSADTIHFHEEPQGLVPY
jgi:hypothetical protein